VRNAVGRAECLESVRDLARQIVVVDTGSTDWTRGIAARYGAEVYAFDWCDDFSAARKYVRIIVEQVLNHPLDKHLILNVNFPAIPDSLIKGIKVCRQAYAKYEEDFLERNDPSGRKYYWLTGKFVNFDKGEDNDEWAIANNYVSVVPCQFDLTAHKAIAVLNDNWEL